jgi:hypothetical protein
MPRRFSRCTRMLLMEHSLRERSVTIDVRDRNHRFVSGASVEMYASGRFIAAADNITKAATFHVNDPEAPLRFVATYGKQSGSVNLAAGTWDYEIILEDLELAAETPSLRFVERHLVFIFGASGIIVTILLAILFPNTQRPDLYKYLAILAALSGGGIASEIPGFLSLRYSPSRKLLIAAGGALAVFVIMYFFKPA